MIESDEDLDVVLEEPEFKVGTRVGAFRDIQVVDESKVMRFIGFGTYEGEFLYGDVHSMRGFQTLEEIYGQFVKTGEKPFSRVRLDDGNVLWSKHCWFVDEPNLEALQREMDYIEDHPVEDFLAEVELSEQKVQEFFDAIDLITVFNEDCLDDSIN